MTAAVSATEDSSTMWSTAPHSRNWANLSNTSYDTVTNVTDLDANSTLSSACPVLQFHSDFLPWDNPDNILSAQTEDFVRRLRDFVVLPTLFLIGGPANVINMAVFYKQGLKERINVCLFSLSLSDGLYLLYNIVLYGEKLGLQFNTREKYGPFMRILVNNHLLGFYGFTWVSQIITAIIASERCFCILQPLRSQTLMRTSTITIVIGVVYVVVVALFFLSTSKYSIVCVSDPLNGREMWITVLSEFYLKNRKLVDTLDLSVYGVGLPIVMIVVVTTTTTITAVKLRQAARWRAGTSSSSSVSPQEIALTKMLVYISCFFIACVFPLAVFRFAWLFQPEMNPGRRYHNFAMASIWVIDMLTYVNATFNILVYYTMGSRYRQTFWTLLGRKRKNKPPETVATLHTTYCDPSPANMPADRNS